MGPTHSETLRATVKEASAALLAGQPTTALQLLATGTGAQHGAAVRSALHLIFNHRSQPWSGCHAMHHAPFAPNLVKTTTPNRPSL